MRTILIALLFLFPLTVRAEQPLGCYLTSSGYCYSGQLTCNATSSINYSQMGYAMGDFCDRLLALIAYGSQMSKDLESCDKNIKELYTTYTQCSALNDQWEGTAIKLTKTIRKLRKACGKKCKRIK